MTRQKKEIMKKLDEIQKFIDVELQIGGGCLPVGCLDDVYSMARELEEELARLMHYNSYVEYCMDDRWLQLVMKDSKVSFL